MTIRKMTPYLMLPGTAKTAIAFYEKSLGARVEMVVHYGDMKIPGYEPPPEDAQRVMHALLHIGGATLMLSDSQKGDAQASGNAVRIAVDFDDPEDLVGRANALVEGGGAVIAPPSASAWSEKFAMVTDRFGIFWMLDCPHKR